jgi:hypothetical protein
MKKVLDQCPTCIRAKQTKEEPAGPNSTRSATQPYQGLSIDFSFSGTKSKDKERAREYVGLNGETRVVRWPVFCAIGLHLYADRRFLRASL